jgi:hypothetical protein
MGDKRKLARLGNLSGPRCAVCWTVDGLRKHSLIGFDRETPEIRSMRQRIQGLEAAVHFAYRTDSDSRS